MQDAIDNADMLLIENNVDHRFGYKSMMDDNLNIFFNDNTNKDRVIIAYKEQMLDRMPEARLFLDYLRNQKKVVILSDEGSPLINDSGTLAIKMALNDGHKIKFLSGPSTPMLTYSNAFNFINMFPSLVDGFCFLAARSDDPRSIDRVNAVLNAGVGVVLNFTGTWSTTKFDELFGNRKVILCLDMILETENVWLSELKDVDIYTSNGGLLSMFILPDFSK